MKPLAPPQTAPVIALATANSRKGARRDLKPCSAWAASTSLRGSRSKAYFGYSRSLRADRGFATTAAKTAVFVLAATLPPSDISQTCRSGSVCADFVKQPVAATSRVVKKYVCVLSGNRGLFVPPGPSALHLASQTYKAEGLQPKGYSLFSLDGG